MDKNKIYLIGILVAIVILAAVLAVNWDKWKPEETRYEISKSTMELEVGETDTLTVTIVPKVDMSELTWESLDPAVATVSNGVVTGISPGETLVQATYHDVHLACAVIVTAEKELKGIEINPRSLNLEVGASNMLSVITTPAGFEDQVKWWSSSEAIVDVFKGKATAIIIGEATITAEIGDVKAECKVTVSPHDISDVMHGISTTTLYLDLGVGETGTMSARTIPAGDEANISWSSSNEAVATVSGGEVTAVSAGKATITAEYMGYKVNCEVTVS